MKNILEQNFDKLYAQAQSRITDVVHPVHQMNTFTKIMLFETVNLILMEIFGNTRFMFMIESTATEFIIHFVDRYKIESTSDLRIPIVKTFVFPDVNVYRNMTEQQKKEFQTLAVKYGIDKEDLEEYYQAFNQSFVYPNVG